MTFTCSTMEGCMLALVERFQGLLASQQPPGESHLDPGPQHPQNHPPAPATWRPNTWSQPRGATKVIRKSEKFKKMQAALPFPHMIHFAEDCFKKILADVSCSFIFFIWCSLILGGVCFQRISLESMVETSLGSRTNWPFWAAICNGSQPPILPQGGQ